MAKDQRGLGLASFYILCLLISGMGVGWLLGLSVSPVLHIIVASVIALVIGVVGALAGLESNPDGSATGKDSQTGEISISANKKSVKINPFPMTALIAGLVIGASFGVYTRTNELLGANPQRLAQRWNGVSGLDEASIKRRLFDQYYPPPASTTGASYERPPATEEGETPPEKPSPTSGNTNSNKIRKVDKTQPDKPPSSATTITSHTAGLFSISVEDCELLSLKHGDTLRARLRALNKKRINAYLDKCSSDECLESLKEMLCIDKD